MSGIRSDQKHQAVAFKQKDPRSSMAIMLSDSSPDASWRLRIEVETADGGIFTLGAVDTIPPNLLVVTDPNRLIAVCSIPGALQWRVFAELLAGTPLQNRTTVLAEMKLSSCPEYAAGCCPLVAIPGNSVDVNTPPGPNQTPNGPPPEIQVVRFFSGSGRALALDVAYHGAGMGTFFAQQHDVNTTDALSDSTMVGIGWPFSLPTTQTITFRWAPASEGRLFSRGYAVALSTTQDTYTRPPEMNTISAFGQWST